MQILLTICPQGTEIKDHFSKNVAKICKNKSKLFTHGIFIAKTNKQKGVGIPQCYGSRDHVIFLTNRSDRSVTYKGGTKKGGKISNFKGEYFFEFL